MKKNKINYSHLFITIFAFILILIGIYGMINNLFNNKPNKANENNQVVDQNEDVNKNQDKTEDKAISSKYSAIITSESEKNSDIVAEYFTYGMSLLDYKNTIEKIDEYLDIKGKYEKINYNFEKQYHYSELEEIYKALALSDIVKLEIIGESVDGRKMYSLEIGNGEDVTMFEAGIHASESANPLFITKFMVDLVNDYEAGDKDVIELLKNHKIVVLPAANPDGYEITLFGTKYLNNQNLFLASATEDNLKYLKCNANGVDLNRNFPSQTAGLYYSKYDLHSSVSLKKTLEFYSYFPGDTLASEPETRAIMYWQNKWISKMKSYVALHSSGRVIYNGKPYLSDEYNNNSNKCARIVGNITGYTVLSKNDEDAGEGNDGTASEYMAESLSGFTFSSVTGRLSSDYYAKYYDTLKYENTCVIVIEALGKYTDDLEIISDEYYNNDLEKAYKAVIEKD